MTINQNKEQKEQDNNTQTKTKKSCCNMLQLFSEVHL